MSISMLFVAGEGAIPQPARVETSVEMGSFVMFGRGSCRIRPRSGRGFIDQVVVDFRDRWDGGETVIFAVYHDRSDVDSLP
jgi:hypothetical protein